MLRIGLRLLAKGRLRSDLTVNEWRQRVEFFDRFVPKTPKRVVAADIDAAGVPLQIIIPAGVENRHILYLHGGGYIIGSSMLYRDITWRIAKRARARVYCVNYRLVPEHPFPAALDDTVAAYHWLIATGVHPRQVAILGDSAGGGLALAALLRLRDEGTALPGAAVVISPWTDLALTGPSFKQNVQTGAMMFDIEAVSDIARQYLAGSDPYAPYASPLYGDPAGLPPILIQVASDEILLDDSVRMAERARAAGGKVDLEIWSRVPHGWHFFARVLPEARQAIERIGAFLRSNISGAPS
jgi:acetyl esterase/lipase